MKSESDLHRVGAVAGRTVIDHFDVVAVRIEHKGAAVARVVGAFAGRAADKLRQYVDFTRALS